ncbi:hypothetical protein [Aurantimicrobium minutum]|uniref:hypothetical protein n=1 Tax=Aurantimicrobium minutum TaxID=708131 RepID=UPI00247375B0|nr:hypothetical protein [Aurantimicrobium minutum]MDH6256022.1 hypothetical protein [Aurantimicrobium minutum]
MSTRIIGSSWSSVDQKFLLSTEQKPPWDSNYITAEYFETGRQVLGSIQQNLYEAGKRYLHVPELFCDSIVSPFIESGNNWNVSTYPLNLNLRPEFETFNIPAEQSADETVVLFISYFGMIFTNKEISYIENLKSHGITVVFDETHSIFSNQEISADIKLASLRKLLPIPDGSYLISNRDLIAPTQKVPQKMNVWAGIEARDLVFSGLGTIETCREIESKVEKYLTNKSMASSPSLKSQRLIERFDYEYLGSTRLSNYVFLYRSITDIDISEEINESFVPSHFVIRPSDPKKLQLDLAKHSIYCPIHWADSSYRFLHSSKNGTLLSIPIDHRYGDDALKRISEVLNKHKTDSSIPTEIVPIYI